MIPVKNGWKPILEEISHTESYQQLRMFLADEYRHHQIYPPMNDLWTAYQWTDYKDVKVVILGQDPYHGPNQAHGLSFSVRPDQPIPPSLMNIYKELEQDLGISPVNHGYLKYWSEQGVLLLNTVLTVRAHQPHSHRHRGWEEVTDATISALNSMNHPIVYLLWGKAAQSKAELIDTSKHLIIESSHPSPFSARYSFLGSRPFSRVNRFLRDTGQEIIDWQLPKLN